MNWDDLRIFLSVARDGTLAQAGARLNVDPTTVARRIQRLERALATSLFEHTASGHVLTARGNALLSQAQTMEESVIAATEGGSTGSGATQGTFRISVSEGFGNGIIAPHLHEFAALYPEIAIELVASTGFLNPSRREADIAIMLARPKSGPLVVRKLADYRLGLYGTGQGLPKTMAELGAHRLVGYVPDLIYSPELRYLDEVGGTPVASLASSSVIAQAHLVRSGAGVGILPCFIAGSDPAFERLLPEEIDFSRAFWLVVHRDMRGITRIRLFIDWLDQLVKRLRGLLLGTG
jgi:DNA-binding transcriptional LysR family regulator